MEVISKTTWKTLLSGDFFVSDLDFELSDIFWLAKFFELSNVFVFLLDFIKSPLF